MSFHAGDVASAISTARALARPLLIALHLVADPTCPNPAFTEIDDARSADLDEVWRRSEIQNELSSHWVALRLDAPTLVRGDPTAPPPGSGHGVDKHAGFIAFAQIYPNHAAVLPNAVGLNPNDGSVLFGLAVGLGEGTKGTSGLDTDWERTLAKLVESRQAFHTKMAAANGTPANGDTADADAADASGEPPAPAPRGTPETRLPTAAGHLSHDGSRRVTAGAGTSKNTPEKEKESVSKPESKTKNTVVAKPVPIVAHRIAVRVRLPNGSTVLGSLALDATVGDVRAFVRKETPAGVLLDGNFELWQTWPKRERVDCDGDEKTLSALGLRDRPALEVVLPSSNRALGFSGTRGLGFEGHVSPNANARDTPGTPARRSSTSTNAGLLNYLAQVLQRAWALLGAFLGLGDAPPLLGGETDARDRRVGEEAHTANLGTQNDAWAAATRGVGASRGRGGNAEASSSKPGGARTEEKKAKPAGAGNVHTLGSTQTESESDRRTTFDNGNSTVWGGDGSDGDDDAGGPGGGTMDVF